MKRGGETVSIKGGCVEGLEWKGAKHIWLRSMVADVELREGCERWDGEPEEDGKGT